MSFALKLVLLLLALGAFDAYTTPDQPIAPSQQSAGEGGSPPPPKP
jgi:hypothetical protein